MKRKVIVLLVVFCLMFAGTALAHPFVIREGAQRPTDRQIDEFLASHAGDEWNVFGIQFYETTTLRWHFHVFAVPRGETPYEIWESVSQYWERIEIRIRENDKYDFEFDFLRSDGVLQLGMNSHYTCYHKMSMEYSIVHLDPMTPLQMAMEGATETMTTPVRQLAPGMMTTLVGLVGFAKGWTWLKKQLSGA